MTALKIAERKSEDDVSGYTDAEALVRAMAVEARAASRILARSPAEAKNRAIAEAAALIRARRDEILAANARDLAEAAGKELTGAFLDRLTLTSERVEAMATSLDDVAALPDPVGRIIAEWTRPNGLLIQRVSVPLGVIGVIYESRPNVTADAGALCFKSGNAVILRGGSESFHSSAAIHACLTDGIAAAGLPTAAVSLVPTRDRAAVGAMLGAMGLIDVVIPRGGKSLIARVEAESRVPVLAHLEGICHVYVDKGADLAKARAITVNAKMRRVGICGAAETLLVDRARADMLKPIIEDLIAAGCEVRGDDTAQRADPRVRPASPEDWDTEYLAPIITAGVVDGVGGAIRHIEAHGSGHTDTIVTEDRAAADRFLAELDSAIVLHNASTQFADGGEFGMGAEIGISTNRLHARGPVGLEELTSFKYVVRGDGQIRP